MLVLASIRGAAAAEPDKGPCTEDAMIVFDASGSMAGNGWGYGSESAGSVPRIENHPIQKARDLGLNFSINTDDAGSFQCSMNSEYALVADLFDFDEGDFATIYANALAARFQPELRIGRLNNP